MIDLANESLIGLAQAAVTLPPGRLGKKVHFSTILRWVLKGGRTPDGRVQLEAIRLGGRWLTSREALQRFADRQTPDYTQQIAAPRTSAARLRAALRAEQALIRMGV
jgi:hypothetical protein